MGHDLLVELLERLRKTERRFEKVRQVEQAWWALPTRDTREALDLAAAWLAAHLERIDARGFVVGVSGGVDSSLAAVLCQQAAPGRCQALLMPCHSDPDDESDGRRLLEALGMAYRVIPLEESVQQLLGLAVPEPDSVSPLVRGNLVSRLRASLLYLEANRTGSLVVGTGDMDEAYIGYTCKGTTADLFPITGLHKEEVRTLLRVALGDLDPSLAERLASRPASPGYWQGQRAEDELGLGYAQLGAALELLVQHCDIQEGGAFPRDPEAFVQDLQVRSVPPADVLRLVDLIAANYHKSFGSPSLYRSK
ncbi:MAG: NAD(+) synthase [Candidatus Eremiobacterota bacterium]